MSQFLGAIKNQNPEFTMAGVTRQHHGTAMVHALQKKCPAPHTRLPEPKFVAYREEFDGYAYKQGMGTMKPRAEFLVFKRIGAHDDINMAMGLRAEARKELMQMFWRRLGAA